MIQLLTGLENNACYFIVNGHIGHIELRRCIWFSSTVYDLRLRGLVEILLPPTFMGLVTAPGNRVKNRIALVFAKIIVEITVHT